MAQTTSREIKVKYNESIELDVRGNKVELTRLEAEKLRDELDEVLSNELELEETELEYECECECIPPQCPYEAWTQWAQWPWIEPWVPMWVGSSGSVTISNDAYNGNLCLKGV